MDPYRPVITNDGWEHTISDIITIHDYTQDSDALKERFLEHKEEILSSNPSPYSVKAGFADGFSYQGQPVIISEYGGAAMETDSDGWGYGGRVSKEKVIQKFQGLTAAIKEIPYICGYCYTQDTDVQQEINGMMDMNAILKSIRR